MTKVQKVVSVGICIICFGSVLCFNMISDLAMASACSVSFISVAMAVCSLINSKTSKRNAQMVISAANKELQIAAGEYGKKTANFENHKQLLETIMRNVPYSIFWKDTELVYQGCNDSFAKISGLDKVENIVGKTDYDFGWPKESAHLFRKRDREVMKSDSALFNIKETVVDGNGKNITIITSKIPLHNSVTGAVCGVLGIHIDSTYLKEITQTVASGMPQFLDAVSIMPVGIVALGPCDTIMEANSYFTNIFGKSGEALLGKSVFGCMWGQLAETLKDVIKSFKSSLEDGPKTFQQIINDTHFQITAQPVFAQKAYAGAVISITDINTLTAESEQTDEAKNQLFAKMSYEIRTYVSGIIGFAELLRDGEINPEQSEFVDMICTSSENLLDSLNAISIEADINTSLLPDKTPLNDAVYEVQTEPLKEAGESTDSSQAPLDIHILIVDDITENNKLIGAVLKRAGYKTTSCENGEDAVSLAQSEQFDIILMDIHMPGMDGLEVTKIIRSQGGLNSKTPIIAITANAGKKKKVNCLEIGCDDYIFKPAKSELLLKKINRFLQRKQQLENAARGECIVSSLAENPDYNKMIEVFVKDLPEQIKQMCQALEENNLQKLCLNIHSLKELSSFAGFPIYTEKAREIGQMIDDDQIDKVAARLDELVELCDRTVLACI